MGTFYIAVVLCPQNIEGGLTHAFRGLRQPELVATHGNVQAAATFSTIEAIATAGASGAVSSFNVVAVVELLESSVDLLFPGK